MHKFLIRFNKSRGQPGRGSPLHVWRVFKDEQEYLAKYVRINVPTWSEQSGPDWNIACKGTMQFFSDTDTIVIS